jgi:glycine/D-amino acid oxidase-like deaminating enzyme
MDLTSGNPFWPILDGLPTAYPRLDRDLRCDVAVIGGGITGALVAHRFAREGIGTVLLEAGEIGHGSTAATTALIQYEIDAHLVDLIERVGRDHAERSYRLCLDAVRGIGELAGEDCAWRATRSLYLASRLSDRAVLEREHRARRQAGIELQLLDESDIRQRFAFTAPAALLSPVAGELDAFRLAHKLLKQAAGSGLEVYDRTRVVDYDARPRGVDLRTDGGTKVRARRVVFATGYETPEFLDRSIVRLHSTFALATAPMAGFDGWGEDRCLIWETARPYFYARTTPDGRAMMGGADRPFATAHHRRRLLTRRPRGSRPGSASCFRISAGTWTGAGEAPSGRHATGCPTSARSGSSRMATSLWGTAGTASPSAGSRPISCWIAFSSDRMRTPGCSPSTGRRSSRAMKKGAPEGAPLPCFERAA